VARVIELMEANRTEPLPVADLALAVNLCPSYLTRLFREHTGRSPARYDKDQRLEHARELLLSTFLSVKEVMAAVGWNDPSHFGREFKRRFGVGPRQLRDGSRG
jgi:transcriptional regulator GlxA family with amidase domain